MNLRSVSAAAEQQHYAFAYATGNAGLHDAATHAQRTGGQMPIGLPELLRHSAILDPSK